MKQNGSQIASRMHICILAALLLGGCVYTPKPISTFENGITQKLSALEKDPAWRKKYDSGPEQEHGVSMTDSEGNSFKGHVVLTAIDKQQPAVAQSLEGELAAKSPEEAADLRKTTGTGNCRYTVQYEYKDGKWRITEVHAEQTALDGGCLRESAPAWIDQLDLTK